jgi:hypothetical protein
MGAFEKLNKAKSKEGEKIRNLKSQSFYYLDFHHWLSYNGVF